MFPPVSGKEIASCSACGFLLQIGRVCKVDYKPLSSKNFLSEGPIWDVLQDTKMSEVTVPSTPPHVAKQRMKRKDSQHLLKKQPFT